MPFGDTISPFVRCWIAATKFTSSLVHVRRRRTPASATVSVGCCVSTYRRHDAYADVCHGPHDHCASKRTASFVVVVHRHADSRSADSFAVRLKLQVLVGSVGQEHVEAPLDVGEPRAVVAREPGAGPRLELVPDAANVDDPGVAALGDEQRVVAARERRLVGLVVAVVESEPGPVDAERRGARRGLELRIRRDLEDVADVQRVARLHQRAGRERHEARPVAVDLHRVVDVEHGRHADAVLQDDDDDRSASRCCGRAAGMVAPAPMFGGTTYGASTTCTTPAGTWVDVTR